MIVAIIVAGAVLTAIGWRLVEARGASIWVVMGGVNAAVGVAALATGRVPLSPGATPWLAALAGFGAGVALYLTTVTFVVVVRRWAAFDRHVNALYARRGSPSTSASVLLAAGLTAPGEEIFWRGLFQSHLASSSDPRLAAAVVTWVVYIAANAASLSLPITIAAVVAGGVWGLLALWTGGVLASVLCHATWTGLMIGVPPPGVAVTVKAAA